MALDQLYLSAAGIVWRQRFLLVLGLLATAGGLLLNLLFRLASPLPEAGSAELGPFALQEALAQFSSPATLVAGVLVVFAAVILFWLVSAIAEGGLITAVQSIDQQRPLTSGEALRSGVSLIGRFIGIDTLLFLPLLILTLALMLVGIGALAGLVVVATRPAAQAGDLLLVTIVSGVVGAPLLLLMALTSVIILVMRTLAFRAAALEDLSAGASIRRAWRVLRSKLLTVTLMVLILWAIRSLLGMPLRLISLTLVALELGQFTLAAAGGGQLPAGSGATLGLAGIIVALLSGLLAAILNAFGSTSWTIGYGQWSDDVE